MASQSAATVSTPPAPPVANATSVPAGNHNLLPLEKCPQYVSILEDALDQLGVLMDIESDHKTDSRPLGEEITRILKDQRALESRYKELVSGQPTLKSLPNKTKFKAGRQELNDISHELATSTQTLAKGLKSHPSVAANLFKIQNERSALQTLVSRTLREVSNSGRFDSLAATVDEEYRKKSTLHNTINSETEASETLKELQKELALEKSMLEQEANERNAVIQQLKDTIQEINSLTTSEQRYIKKETRAHEASVRQKCTAKELCLEKDKEAVLLKIRMEERAHEKVMDFLERQRGDMESSIQSWMTKYEEDTEAKTNELESIKQRRSSDLEKFEALVRKFEELERVVEEDRAVKKSQAEEIKMGKIKNFAAIRIQTWYLRHHAIRMEQAMAANPILAAKKGKGAKGAKKK